MRNRLYLIVAVLVLGTALTVWRFARGNQPPAEQAGGIDTIRTPVEKAASAEDRREPILPGGDVLAYGVELFAAFDDIKQVHRFVHSFTEDGWLQAGNAPRLQGHESLDRDLRGLLDFAPTRHVVKAGARSGDTIFLEVDVHYMPKGKTAVTIPSVISVKLAKDGRVKAMFVAMDRSPSHPLRDEPEKLYSD